MVGFIKFGMGEIPHIILEFFLFIVFIMTGVNIPKTGEWDSATVQQEPNPHRRIVKDVFYATAIVRGEIAPPAAVGLRL